MKLKVGIIGCGAIGSELGKAIGSRIPGADLVAVADVDEEKARKLSKNVFPVPRVLSPEELIDEVALVIECASSSAVAAIAEKTLSQGKDIMVMSVGGLLGKMHLFRLAQEKGARIYLPSGALAGLDGVKAAAAGRIDSVILTTRKPPAGLKGAPHLEKAGIDLDALTEEETVFEGTAEEAVEGFPRNINVAATLSLAGIGPAKTRVKIVADPKTSHNVHEIKIEGEFGRLISRTENLPSPSNPKTSFLAILSAIATLEAIVSPVRIGT
ncbi:MAG: aspartate dehydrogenase [Nitrospirae bacterium]|nr:aspartate dehydrogenase [Nitrospirota bacterium]